MPNISPSWVQAGELGLAFVVIILCAWLVLYTMKTSASREKMLMDLIKSQQSKLTELSTTMQKMADGVGDIVNRLESIEDVIEIKPKARKRKPAA